MIFITLVSVSIAEDIAVEEGSEQQRKLPRYRVDVRAKVIYRRNGLNQSAIARGQDVSAGGMAMFVPIELRKEDALEIEFTLPHSRLPLRVRAMVRNSDGHRYGLEFLNLTDVQKQEITRMCETLMLV
ncbi:MAG: PilZ domain-containing protein [Acidobacteriaceae bacterium]